MTSKRSITIEITADNHRDVLYANGVEHAKALIADQAAMYKDACMRRWNVLAYYEDAVQYDEFGSIIVGRVDFAHDTDPADEPAAVEIEKDVDDDVDEFGFTAEDREELDAIFGGTEDGHVEEDDTQDVKPGTNLEFVKELFGETIDEKEAKRLVVVSALRSVFKYCGLGGSSMVDRLVFDHTREWSREAVNEMYDMLKDELQ